MFCGLNNTMFIQGDKKITTEDMKQNCIFVKILIIATPSPDEGQAYSGCCVLKFFQKLPLLVVKFSFITIYSFRYRNVLGIQNELCKHEMMNRILIELKIKFKDRSNSNKFGSSLVRTQVEFKLNSSFNPISYGMFFGMHKLWGRVNFHPLI